MTNTEKRALLVKAYPGWMIDRDPRQMTEEEVEQAYRRIFGGAA